MGIRTHTIEARGIRVEVDLDLGQLAKVEITRDGRRVAPFHRAPWADEPGPIEGTERAPHLARLSGDFFCAPFGLADVEPAPPHGWPANGPWELIGSEKSGDATKVTLVLDHKVMGARVLKELTVRDGHPFLYQRHVFESGTGSLSVANHAMVHFPNGGRLSFSPKRWAETPATALETDPARGRFVLAYPEKSTDLSRFPLADGGTVDLTRYPIGERHEDFAMLVEAEGATLGWSVALRPQEGDLALTLKNPAVLPVTMLWFSNGGRDYAPWNGRHRDVLGIEDACAYSAYGHKASISPNPMNEAGIPTAIQLKPDGSVEVRHVIGAVPAPEGLREVGAVRAEREGLVVEDAAGKRIVLPFDAEFLGAESMTDYRFATAENSVLPMERASVFFDGMFSEPRLQHPEGVAIGPDGWVWCGNENGAILRIAPDGSAIEEVASTGGFTLGLAFEGDRALFTCDLKHLAVFRLDLATRKIERFTEPGIRIPNYPVVDRARGKLYVSDSYGSPGPGPGVWAFDLATGEGGLWYSEPLTFANGMALTADGSALLVCETFARLISRIPIGADGKPGKAEPYAADLPGLPDGVALDGKGALFVSCYEPSRILRVPPGGGKAEVYIEDPTAHLFAHPTNIAFDGPSLYAANIGRWHITRIETDTSAPPLHASAV